MASRARPNNSAAAPSASARAIEDQQNRAALAEDLSKKYFLGYGLVEYWKCDPSPECWRFGGHNSRNLDESTVNSLMFAFGGSEFCDRPVDRSVPLGIPPAAIKNIDALLKGTPEHSGQLPRVEWAPHMKFEAVEVYNGRVSAYPVNDDCSIQLTRAQSIVFQHRYEACRALVTQSKQAIEGLNVRIEGAKKGKDRHEVPTLEKQREAHQELIDRIAWWPARFYDKGM